MIRNRNSGRKATEPKFKRKVESLAQYYTAVLETMCRVNSSQVVGTSRVFRMLMSLKLSLRSQLNCVKQSRRRVDKKMLHSKD